MKLYIYIILIAMAVITALNVLFGMAFIPALLCVVLATVSVIALDGVEAWLIRALPARILDPDRITLGAGKREARFYKKLKIGKWKEKIPELYMFTGFSKGKVAEPKNPRYLHRFLLEANYGVAIHFVNALTGCLLVLLFPVSVALPVAAVNLALSLMAFATLRYNIPKLKALYLRAKRGT